MKIFCFMLRYRLIKKSDISKIRSVALQCWLDAYKQIYKESIIKKFIANFYSMENIDKSIQNAIVTRDCLFENISKTSDKCIQKITD